MQVWAGKRGARAAERAAADDGTEVERVRSHPTIEVPAGAIRVHGDGEACASGGGGGCGGGASLDPIHNARRKNEDPIFACPVDVVSVYAATGDVAP